MSLKKKLVATIGMFCLTCALLLVGVWAISSTSVEIGGTISFEATNVYATVTGSIDGADTPVSQPKQLKYSTTEAPTSEELNSWKQNLKFDSVASPVSISINVKNDSATRGMHVALVDNSSFSAPLEISIAADGTTYTSGQDLEIAGQEDVDFVITFTIADPDIAISGNYNFTVYLRDGSAEADYHEKKYVYTVEGEGEEAIAYKTTICPTCDDKVIAKEALEEGTYVIATETDAQQILDGDINGKTVIFTDGVYGNLEIRPTLATTTKLFAGATRETELDVAGLSTLPTTGVYGYERRIENVILTATEGAEFRGLFSIISDRMNNYAPPTATVIGLGDSNVRHDPIRNIDCGGAVDQDGERAYVAYMPIKNLTFEGMNFTTANGRIYMYNRVDHDGVDGVTVSNCSFKTEIGQYWGNGENSPVKLAAVYLYNSGGASETVYSHYYNFTYKNIVMKNNVVENHYIGLAVQNIENVKMANNTVKNSVHASLLVQSATGNTFSGHILIEGNTLYREDGLTFAKERAIRMGTGKNATVDIKNNDFTNIVDGDSELIKTNEGCSGCRINFVGNTYDGVALDDEQFVYPDQFIYVIDANV